MPKPLNRVYIKGILLYSNLALKISTIYKAISYINIVAI